MNLELSSQLSDRALKNVVPPERLNSQIEIIKSRHLLGQLVNTLGLAKTEEAETREVTRLRKAIEVRLVPASTIIEISYSDKDPAMATRVVNTLASLYRTYHLAFIEGDDGLKFYEAQFGFVDKRLKEDYVKLNDLRNRVGVLSDFTEEQKTIQDRINTLNLTMSTFESRVNELQAKVNTLSNMLAAQPKQIKSSVDMVPNPDAVSMRAQLTTLEMEKATLLMKYTLDSREVKDKNEEIALLKSRLAQLSPVVEGKNVLAINSNYQTIEKDLTASRAELEGVKQSRASAMADLKTNQQKLADLNNYAYEFMALEHAVAENNKIHGFYLARLDDAQFMDAVNKQGISSLSIIEAADGTNPKGSPIAVSLGMALALGAALAFGVVLMIEWFKPTLDSAEQVRDALTLPVLATISERHR
jgi:uncharacterized protein involved in exopolysaccharide biosynthesis